MHILCSWGITISFFLIENFNHWVCTVQLIQVIYRRKTGKEGNNGWLTVGRWPTLPDNSQDLLHLMRLDTVPSELWQPSSPAYDERFCRFTPLRAGEEKWNRISIPSKLAQNGQLARLATSDFGVQVNPVRAQKFRFSAEGWQAEVRRRNGRTPHQMRLRFQLLSGGYVVSSNLRITSRCQKKDSSPALKATALLLS